MSEAVQAYVVSLRDRGLRGSTVERAETHLRRLFQLDVEDADGKTIRFANPGGMLEDLRERRCAELYEIMTKEAAVDTHRNALAAAKAFGT